MSRAGIDAAASFASLPGIHDHRGRDLPTLPEAPRNLTALDTELCLVSRTLRGRWASTLWAGQRGPLIVQAELSEYRTPMQCWSVSVDYEAGAPGDAQRARLSVTGRGPSLAAAQDALIAALGPAISALWGIA